MADFIFNFVSATPQTLVGSESGYITHNGGVITDGSDAVTATAGTNWLTVHGHLYAYDGGFAAVDADGTVFEMNVGERGYVGAENATGGTIDANLSTLFSLNNQGTIHSNNSDAINFIDSDGSASFDLQNSGVISSNSSETIDVDVGTGEWSIHNSGLITGYGETIELTRDNGDAGTSYLTNTGEITSLENDAIFVVHGDVGTLEIANHGIITGRNAALDSNSNGRVEIINTGIFAASDSFGEAIELEGGDDEVINAGQMIGNVYLGAGNDVFDTRGGTVTGDVQGETGDDTYIIDDSSITLIEFAFGGTDEVRIADDYALSSNFENLRLLGAEDINGVGNSAANVLTGNAGSNRLGGGLANDTLNGGEGDDSLYGGGDSDSLSGGDGDDYLSAGAAADELYGNDGDDVLLGRRGSDLLNGGEGADTLDGGTSGDVILGGREDDLLIGGEGSDSMNGGQGIDTFLWRTASESPDGAGRDVINGFETGVDVLDISAIGIVDINIGGGLTGGGTPSLRTFETVGGDTRVFVDVDGDGAQDMRFDILGVTGVTEIDFLA